MTKEQYISLFLPALLKVAERCVENEKKYFEGLRYSPHHGLKAIGHLSKSMRSINDENTSHAVAAAYNSLMMVLYEECPQIGDRDIFKTL